jgi:transcriptional regulator GlxA family with amidase domain
MTSACISFQARGHEYRPQWQHEKTNGVFPKAATLIIPTRIPGHLQRAIEYIRSNLPEPLKVLSIADYAYTSERKLYRSFQKHLQTTPVQYIKEQRLMAINRALKLANRSDSVTSIAMDYGVNQFGRMSVQYKKRFGESPSTTIRKARSSKPHADQNNFCAPGLLRAS